MSVRILIGSHGGHGSALVEAGGLLFTAGCEGQRRHDDDAIDPALEQQIEAQCENAYGGIARWLAQAGVGLDSVVRLDHFTQSQDWLPRRAAIRARLWGKPAPLTSTGVAARMSGINLVTAAAVAVPTPAAKRVLVGGPEYGMANISSALAAGPFVFVSGLRAAAAGPSLDEQAPASYRKLRAILDATGTAPQRIVRLESFLRSGHDPADDAAAARAVLATDRYATTRVELVLGGNGDLEITTIALANGAGPIEHLTLADGVTPAAVVAGGFAFIDACAGPGIADALRLLVTKLRCASLTPAAVARLDLYLGEEAPREAIDAALRDCFGTEQPAVLIGGAVLPPGTAAMACAIAHGA